MHTVNYSNVWDVWFDARGIFHARGGADHHHSQAIQVILRNTQTDRLDEAAEIACKAAASLGQAALEAWVRRTFAPSGFAKKAEFWT